MKRIGRCRVWLSIEPQLACFGQIRFTPALMHTLRRIPVDLMGYILLFRFFFFLSFFFFFLFMDLENFVPCSLFCPPCQPSQQSGEIARSLVVFILPSDHGIGPAAVKWPCHQLGPNPPHREPTRNDHVDELQCQRAKREIGIHRFVVVRLHARGRLAWGHRGEVNLCLTPAPFPLLLLLSRRLCRRDLKEESSFPFATIQTRSTKLTLPGVQRFPRSLRGSQQPLSEPPRARAANAMKTSTTRRSIPTSPRVLRPWQSTVTLLANLVNFRTTPLDFSPRDFRLCLCCRHLPLQHSLAPSLSSLL